MSENNGKRESQDGRNGAKRPKTYVAFVMDESGSMAPMRHEAINAFNQQMEAMRGRAVEQEILVSLVKFNTNVPDPVFWNLPAEYVPAIGAGHYRPDGLTAMLDAVGMTLDGLVKVDDANDPNVAFLVCVISDGQENNSKTYTYGSLAERIQALTRTDRWTFTYMGANQDLGRLSRELSIPLPNVHAWEATSEGLRDASKRHRTSADAMFQMRSTGRTSSRQFYTQPDPADAPEPKPENGPFWDK